MFCQKCGSEVAEADNFCRKCGSSLKGKPSAAEDQTQPEFCTIKMTDMRTAGWLFGTKVYYRFVAEVTGPKGRRIELQTEEIKGEIGIFSEERLNEIVDELIRRGWEEIPGLKFPNQFWSKQFRRKVQE